MRGAGVGDSRLAQEQDGAEAAGMWAAPAYTHLLPRHQRAPKAPLARQVQQQVESEERGDRDG